MKKLKFDPRTLEDFVVKDALRAIGTLENGTGSKGKSFIVGGMATQSYLPTNIRRPSCDIDLAVLLPLSLTEFREFSESTQDYLKQLGYDVETKKGHSAFHLIYSKENEAASIEFARRNQNNMNRILPRLLRERENARIKRIEGTPDSYIVSSPEDIAVPKLVRCVGSCERHPELIADLDDLEDFYNFSIQNAEEMRDYIDELRQDAVINPGTPEVSERLRFFSDVYDIKAISEFAGFNESYLIEVLSRWDALGASRQTKPLVERIFPDLALIHPYR